MQIMILEITQNRARICNDLLRSLPLWFGIESAIQEYVRDVETMPMWVAYDGKRPIGFVSLCLHNEYTGEIHVMAIHPDFHRQGIGRKLVVAVEDCLRNRKYEFLTVKTVSPSRSNPEYERTRQFYFSMGFRPVEEFKTLWGANNPCLMMIKGL